jgi:hypothetical protein
LISLPNPLEAKAFLPIAQKIASQVLPSPEFPAIDYGRSNPPGLPGKGGCV